jgi:hypothetical protein
MMHLVRLRAGGAVCTVLLSMPVSVEGSAHRYRKLADLVSALLADFRYCYRRIDA